MSLSLGHKTSLPYITYNIPIQYLRRWIQELHVYNIILLHRLIKMMKCVDELNKGPYQKIVVVYYVMTVAMRTIDVHSNSMAHYLVVLTYILQQG